MEEETKAPNADCDGASENADNAAQAETTAAAAADLNAAPELSILIPIYNEEGILETAVTELLADLRQKPETFEIWLAENGSKDRTVEIAQKLAAENPEVHSFSVGEPNYGRALKEAMFRARGLYIICDEIDLCDTRFYADALKKLRSGIDYVVGSKRAPGADDRRPLFRRAATLVLSGMLRVAVGFKGTDTHGLKAFRREAILPIVESCVVEHDMFTSELTVRVHRSDRRWCEVPIQLEEKRPPSISLLHRVPRVLKNTVRLTSIIRFGRDIKC